MTGPVHNSEVFILGHHPQHAPEIAPPSPPSPVTPSNELCAPIEELSLDNDITTGTRPSSPSPPGTPSTPATPRTSSYDHEEDVSLFPSSTSSSSRLLFDDRLSKAVHVLNTEATSLTSLTHLYATDPVARSAFNAAVEVITSRQQRHGAPSRVGKLIIIGVGKSGHIANKLVATFNSLSVISSYIHPTEALHGDLGHVGPDDTFMLITFSGKTPELSALLPHLDARLPLIVLTGRTAGAEVVMQREREATGKTILLPAPIHESETVSFGVSAPTTSTTMALAVGDALALTCAMELNPAIGLDVGTPAQAHFGSGVARVFGHNHPGGAIGASYRRPQTVRDVMVPLSDICVVSPAQVQCGGDVLRAAYACKTGWVRVGADADADAVVVASPGRIHRMSSAELGMPVASMPWLTVDRAGLISLGAATQLKAAGEWLRANRASGSNNATPRPRGLAEDEDDDEDDEGVCTPGSIVAAIENGEVVGVMEASQILDVTGTN